MIVMVLAAKMLTNVITIMEQPGSRVLMRAGCARQFHDRERI
jgi:hypothetical protein